MNPCLDCGIDLIPDNRWKRFTDAEKADHRRRGYYRHKGRGLCGTCHKAHWARGELVDYERSGRPVLELIEDFQHLDLDRSLSMRRRIQLAAPRLGMTPGALERAFYRARRNGKWEAA